MHRENAKGRQRETERVTEVNHCHSSVFRTFGLSRSIACTCRLRRVHTAAPALDTLVHLLSTPPLPKKMRGGFSDCSCRDSPAAGHHQPDADRDRHDADERVDEDRVRLFDLSGEDAQRREAESCHSLGVPKVIAPTMKSGFTEHYGM
jgi:hypothetical protein